MANCYPERAHTNSIEDHHLELSSDTDSSTLSRIQRQVQWARSRFHFKSRKSDDASSSAGALDEAADFPGEKKQSSESNSNENKNTYQFWMRYTKHMTFIFAPNIPHQIILHRNLHTPFFSFLNPFLHIYSLKQCICCHFKPHTFAGWAGLYYRWNH